MKTKIYCVCGTDKKHCFYLTAGGKTYYLFDQDYHQNVQSYFGKGVCLKEAMDHSRSNRDHHVVHTMGKLPAYIRYIEKEYGIAVLERTKFCGRGNPYRAAKRGYRDPVLPYAG